MLRIKNLTTQICNREAFRYNIINKRRGIFYHHNRNIYKPSMSTSIVNKYYDDDTCRYCKSVRKGYVSCYKCYGIGRLYVNCREYKCTCNHGMMECVFCNVV
jgi:hypothetical protein